MSKKDLLREAFEEKFGKGSGEIRFFSAPGRVEICGNHTDHQNGKVIAAAVDIDMKAAASANGKDEIRIFSEGIGMCEIDISDASVTPATSASLVLGMVKALDRMGYSSGGFDAYVVSDVPSGSGLSSSAAFEILIGNIISGLFNDGKCDPVTLAKAGKTAENEYFGKPSGIMDQLTCSIGGLIYIDLEDPDDPRIRKIDTDFRDFGFSICVVDTGSSHADLTGYYAQIPSDMRKVAEFFGKEVLRQVSEEEMKNGFGELIAAVGNTAAARAVHFINEEERVDDLACCLDAMSEGRGGDLFVKPDPAGEEEKSEELTYIQQALEIICESGDSSFRFLKNVCLPGQTLDSPLAEALDMSWELLQGRGAFRVHGGGFAGTMIAIVPDDLLNDYKCVMEERFGEGSCRILNINQRGGCMDVIFPE